MPFTSRWVGKTASPGSFMAHRYTAIVSALRIAGGAPLGAVGQRRLVAVMTVGDVERAVREGRGDAFRRSPGDGREAMAVAVAVMGFAPGGRIGFAAGRRQRRRHGAVVVRVQEEDLAEVGVGGAIEAQAVFLGSGVSPLVGQHHALVQIGEHEPGDEAAPGALDAVGAAIDLVHEVDGGLLVAHQHALIQPAC